ERVHGRDEAERARRASEALFSGAVARLEPELRRFVAAEVPRLAPIARSAFAAGITAVELAVRSGAADSMSEARRLVAQGGLYVEDVRVGDPLARVAAPAGDGLLLRVGKRRYLFVPIEG
ncbi:MAG TPA: hypothetical protein VIV06_02865, partial [Candidatus Limnocylindrales bacterium]